MVALHYQGECPVTHLPSNPSSPAPLSSISERIFSLYLQALTRRVANAVPESNKASLPQNSLKRRLWVTVWHAGKTVLGEPHNRLHGARHGEPQQEGRVSPQPEKAEVWKTRREI